MDFNGFNVVNGFVVKEFLVYNSVVGAINVASLCGNFLTKDTSSVVCSVAATEYLLRDN